MLQTDFEEVYDPAAFELIHIDTDGASASVLHNHWDVHNPTFPVLVGCQAQYNGYGDGYIPYNVVIDTEGVIRYTDSGFSENQLHNVIEQYMSVDFPVFTINELSVIADDNGDGRPDGGETVSFDVSLRNSPIAVPATGCTVTMTCTDPAVTITQASVTYPAADPGEVVTGSNHFTFTVDEGIEPHWATFTFAYSAPYDGGTATGDIEHLQRMGRPGLLVVDSDSGVDDNETFITDALEDLAMGYDVWAGLDNPLAADEMNRYQTILWLGGTNENDVTDDEEAGLRSFLDGGGRLLLSSQYVSDNPDRADFLSEYFGVSMVTADAGNIFVVDGVTGDPWFDGTALVLTGSQGANNNEEPDVLSVAAPGVLFGTWRQAADAPAAAYTMDTPYAAVFCGFPVEATRVHASVPGSMDSGMFLGHVFDYFTANVLGEPRPVVAGDFRLLGATPNPFNPTTTLAYDLARAGSVALVVYNTVGQEVRRLDAGQQAAGRHSQVLDASDLASGLYLVRLVVDGGAGDAMKIMLVK